jgi:hypothetical protein
MTYAAPSFDAYDDGLVHGHDWSRNTPPGVHHTEARRTQQAGRTGRDHDEASHEHR